MRATAVRIAIGCLHVVACAVLSAYGQAPAPPASSFDVSKNGVTPAAIAPGRPAGSFALSGFDSVNPYSGRLNVALPLMEVGGRGEARYTMMLAVSRPPWTIRTDTTPSHSCQGPVFGIDESCVEYGFSSTLDGSTWWNPYEPFTYGPGVVVGKLSAEDLRNCGTSTAPNYQFGRTFSYIVFVTPDGTEHALYDVKYSGAVLNLAGCTLTSPIANDPAVGNRGTMYVSRDGSGMAFQGGSISDSNNPSVYVLGSGGSVQPVTGVLTTRNGVQYTIDTGRVMAIVDRHGNKLTFNYLAITLPPPYGAVPTYRVNNITDSLGRTITIDYEYNDSQFGGGQICGQNGVVCDRIGYKGASGGQRYIRVQRAKNRILEVDLPNSPGPQQQAYLFSYGDYDEMKRIDLPTGGAVEYDHGPGVDPASGHFATGHGQNGVFQTGWILDDPSFAWFDKDPDQPYVAPPSRPLFYRRLLARREFANGGSGSVAQTGSTDYHRWETAGGTPNPVGFPVQIPLVTQVTVTYPTSPPYVQTIRSGSGATAITENHFYLSSGPAFSLLNPQGIGLPADAFEGLEYKTETPGLLRVENVWGLVDPTLTVAQICQTNTTLLDVTPNQLSGKIYLHDRDVNGVALGTLYNNISDVYEYGYGAISALPSDATTWTCPAAPTAATPGALAGFTRRTHTDYKADAAYTSLPVHLLSLLQSVQIFKPLASSPNAKVTAETDYEYDKYDGSANHSTLATYSDIPQYQDPGTTARGNITMVTQAVARTTDTNAVSTTLSAYRQYDIAGNVTRSIDSNSNPTNITYGYPYGYPTTISDAMSRATQFVYDQNLGQPTSITDQNHVATTYQYGPTADSCPAGDALDRLTQVVRAATVNGALTNTRTQTCYKYDDVNLLVTSTQDRVAFQGSTVFQDSSSNASNRPIKTEKAYDRFGRVIETRLYTDTENSTSTQRPYIATTTNYDGLGRVSQVSNPGDQAIGTTTVYDALGRVGSVILGSLSSLSAPDSAVTNYKYSGNVTTISDPSCVNRQSTTDALGRLTQVVENPNSGGAGSCSASSSPAYTTIYSYDERGDLLSVQQGALAQRSFQYDLLSRLTSATNPESGQIQYNYTTSDGVSLCSGDPKSLCRKTDGRSITTTIAYDLLNRITSKSYNDSPQTPTVTYCYDGTPNTGVCAGAPSGSNSNLLGRLTMVYNSTASPPTSTGAVSVSKVGAYDELGEVLQSSQQTAGQQALGQLQPFGFVYTYDLAGAMVTMQYPSGKVVTYGHDGAGRVNLVQRTQPDTSVYADSIGYAGHGVINSLRLGNNLWETTTFTGRLQPMDMWLGTNQGMQDVWNLHNDYFKNGNVQDQKLAVGTSWNAPQQNYTYDGVNRLLTAGEGSSSWNQAYAYDYYGNRAVEFQLGLSPYTTPVTSGSNEAAVAARFPGNRNDLCGYDSQGNVRGYDGAGNWVGGCTALPATYCYDGENRLTGASATGTCSAPTSAYAYDGEGRRVTRTVGSTTTWYVYDAGGDLASEYTNPMVAGDGTKYLTVDHLGSTRIVTNPSQGVVSCHDYLPFGEEVQASALSGGRDGLTCYKNAGNDGLNQKFTGKERDSETGLDYFGARYLSSAQGRWMSPDWSATPEAVPYGDLSDPQTLNLYGYVRNNPLGHADADGHCAAALPCQWLGPAVLTGVRVVGAAIAGTVAAGAAVVISAKAAITWTADAYVANKNDEAALNAQDSMLHVQNVKNLQAGQGLPANPDDLTEQGYHDVSHPKAADAGHRTFKNPATGDEVRFDQGKPGQPGFAGQDHYHRTNPNATGKGDAYLDANGKPTADGSAASHLKPQPPTPPKPPEAPKQN